MNKKILASLAFIAMITLASCESAVQEEQEMTEDKSNVEISDEIIIDEMMENGDFEIITEDEMEMDASNEMEMDASDEMEMDASDEMEMDTSNEMEMDASDEMENEEDVL